MKLIELDDFRPLIESTVAETVDRIRQADNKVNGRLGYTEPEAAALIGVQPHVLRDCRRRGEIPASKVGKRIVYERDALSDFLRRRRQQYPTFERN